jgi:hypothetical protein
MPSVVSAAPDAHVPPGAAPLLSLEKPATCLFDCEFVPAPTDRPVVSAEHAPPALSGGTLLSTSDGKWLVAADPDRDRIYFVDVDHNQLSHVRELAASAEPGRLIEDGSGRIHVALRGRGALLTLTRAPDSQMTDRARRRALGHALSLRRAAARRR